MLTVAARRTALATEGYTDLSTLNNGQYDIPPPLPATRCKMWLCTIWTHRTQFQIPVEYIKRIPLTFHIQGISHQRLVSPTDLQGERQTVLVDCIMMRLDLHHVTTITPCSLWHISLCHKVNVTPIHKAVIHNSLIIDWKYDIHNTINVVTDCVLCIKPWCWHRTSERIAEHNMWIILGMHAEGTLDHETSYKFSKFMSPTCNSVKASASHNDAQTWYIFGGQ